MQKYLNEEISRIKNVISSNTSSDIADKLAAVTELIESFKRAPINDEVLTKIVKLQSLVKELQNNGNND
jgi:peptide subunit release factor 1 (eRF1)